MDGSRIRATDKISEQIIACRDRITWKRIIIIISAIESRGSESGRLIGTNLIKDAFIRLWTTGIYLDVWKYVIDIAVFSTSMHIA